MKTKTIFKSLLVAAGLLVGQSAWADIEETVVVNCDFNNGETLFTGASRMTVSNDNNVKFTCAGNSQNGYSLATYDFSSVIGEDANAVKIEFLFWIPNQNAAYRRFFTVGQKDLRTGFGKTSYATAGSMFAFGLARNSSKNYFSINGASTTAAADATTVLGAWARAEIYVDHSAKTVNYKITNVENTETYYNADDVAFVDGSASYCNQLDFFDCQNNVVSYLDNLVITKYVDKSKVATTYTVKYQNAGGTDLKDPVVYDTYVGDIYTASSSDMATFYSDDTNTKYIYNSGNTSTEAVETAASNVITLVFDEYAKVAYTVTAKNGEETLGIVTSGDAYTDGSTTAIWSKFKQFDGKWYETTGSYGKVITEAGNTDVAYTASGITYFFEAENLATSRSGFPEANALSYSGGKARRNYSSSQMWTDALIGGTYTLTFPYSMANASASTIVIKTRDAEGTLTETGLSLTTSTAGTFSGKITVPDGSSVAICNDNTYNSNILVDYLTLTDDPVSATIGSDAIATFSSEYAVDFSAEDGVTVYTAKVNDAKTAVVLTAVESKKVPANTGVILKGDAGTYNAAVVASAPALENNQLAVSDGESNVQGAYVLTKSGDKVVFGVWDSETPLTKGRVYLPADVVDVVLSGAKTLNIIFEGETTGINDVSRLNNAEMTSDKVVFNLNGQRIAAPQKGINIINGRKVIVK